MKPTAERFAARIKFSISDDMEKETTSSIRYGAIIKEYIEFLGVPKNVDYSLSPIAFYNMLEEERQAIVQKYTSFCNKRNIRVSEQQFEELKKSRVLQPVGSGRNVLWWIPLGMRKYVQEKGGLERSVMDSLFFGEKGSVDESGAGSSTLYQNSKNWGVRVPFDVRGDSYVYHIGHRTNEHYSAKISNIQAARAEYFAWRKQLNRMFPGKLPVIDNYKAMIVKGVNRDVAKAFAAHCAQYGIPQALDMRNIDTVAIKLLTPSTHNAEISVENQIEWTDAMNSISSAGKLPVVEHS